ncbi:MAG TPA: D-aminoacylase [Thermoanaerobaculia bacterium]|jgi:dihydroorotase/N-acyl-D-amino-acid deacylase
MTSRILLALLFVACTAPPPLQKSAQNDAQKSGSAQRAPAQSGSQYDVVILGGEVIDGTGAARTRADVGIRGDSIAAIGDLSKATAALTLHAKDHVVTPGFIDLLGNSQAAVLLDPKLEGKIRQGVTTEVTGEGHSPGPQNDEMAAEMERTKPQGWPQVTWRTLGEFMRAVEQKGSALNFAFFVGAANPREMVLGHADRAPNADELQRMQAIVKQAMDEGAVGLSSALIYPPGRFATTEELVAMARVAGSYWTHLRNEANDIDKALDEAIRIGREAKVPVNVFHLKIGGQGNWGRMPAILAKIEAAQKSGVDIAANIYPFTATSTDLTSIVPAWALEGGYAKFVERLRDPATRTRIGNELRAGRLANNGAASIVIRGNPSQRLDALAKELKVDPAEAVLQLFANDTRSPIAIFFSLSEEDMKKALVQPWVAFGSDSGAVVGAMRSRGAHPRAYATFSRVLAQYVREQKLLTLEEAVRKMTSLAASRAGLKNRGILRVGMKADIAVFNPTLVRDVSTYEDPHHFSVGVSHVIVNGKPVLRDNKMTGELPGKVLRRATQ